MKLDKRNVRICKGCPPKVGALVTAPKFRFTAPKKDDEGERRTTVVDLGKYRGMKKPGGRSESLF